MPIFKIMGPDRGNHPGCTIAGGPGWALYSSIQMAPEQAKGLALQDAMLDLPSWICPHVVEAEDWTFGEHVLLRTTYLFSGTAAVPKRFSWEETDALCVVLVKGVSAEDATSSGRAFDPDCQIDFSRGGTDRIEVLTLLAPATTSDAAIDIEPGAAASFALGTFIDSLPTALQSLSEREGRRVSDMTRALMTAYFAPRTEKSSSAESVSRPLLFDRARDVVREHLASPEFGPEDLCRLLAVSRSKLYRLFESSGGVANFINNERLDVAHKVLSDPLDMSTINKIGGELGFSDHSTFSRAFKRRFGYSPSDARDRGPIPLDWRVSLSASSAGQPIEATDEVLYGGAEIKTEIGIRGKALGF